MNAQAINQSMAQVEKAAQGFMQACEHVSLITRDHLDAAVKSANVTLDGCHEINHNVHNFVQDSMAHVVNAGKTILSAKSPREAFDLHAEFVKQAFDNWIAGTGKLSEISARVTKEAVSPLAEQANHTISKIVQTAKAA
ncbi:MAG: phasin family protein [Pseudomonadota bacterium]|nr:phasin family protein [Pseudomonadota bacterium]